MKKEIKIATTHGEKTSMRQKKKNFIKSRWLVIPRGGGRWRFEIEDMRTGYVYSPKLVVKGSLTQPNKIIN